MKQKGGLVSMDANGLGMASAGFKARNCQPTITLIKNEKL